MPNHSQPSKFHVWPDAKPERGDIVIGRSTGAPGSYELRASPGPAQIVCPTYDQAFGLAKRLAVHQRVDVWVDEADAGLALVSRHRVGAREPLQSESRTA